MNNKLQYRIEHNLVKLFYKINVQELKIRQDGTTSTLIF